MSKMTRYQKINAGLAAASLAIGVWAYSVLPARIVSHWNIDGQPDGYMSRAWGAYLLPLVALGLYGLFLLIPRIDPKAANIAKFRGHFDQFVAGLMCFLIYIHGLTLVWNLGGRFDFGQVLSPAFALLCILLARLAACVHQNWFVGIRTPWTMSSEKVWNETHILAATLYTWAAGICLVGVIWSAAAFWLVLLGLVGASLTAVVYSYIYYQREQRA